MKSFFSELAGVFIDLFVLILAVSSMLLMEMEFDLGRYSLWGIIVLVCFFYALYSFIYYRLAKQYNLKRQRILGVFIGPKPLW